MYVKEISFIYQLHLIVVYDAKYDTKHFFKNNLKQTSLLLKTHSSVHSADTYDYKLQKKIIVSHSFNC